MYAKVKLLTFAALVLIVSLVTAFANECPSWKHGMKKYEKANMEEKVDWEKKFYYKTYYIIKHYKELGLADDQVDKIKELKYKVKRSAVLKGAEIEALSLDVQKALAKEDANAAEINTLIDKKYEVKKEKAKELVAAYLDLRALLTKEQYKKLKDLWYEHVYGCAKDKDKKET